MRIKSFIFGALAALLLVPSAFAQAVPVLDQVPSPAPSAASAGNSELYTQYVPAAGGAIYSQILKNAAGVSNVSSVYVPGGGGSINRYLNLTDGKSDLGVPMTATAGTPAGTTGVSRTAGTSLFLSGEATSASAKTDKVMFEFNLPSTYVAGATIPIIVNANYTGSGTVTAASTTMTAQFYTENNGVETAGTVTAAQQFTGTAANYTFNVTGTGLTAGQHVVIELVMLVTTSSGAATGQINSVAYKA